MASELEALAQRLEEVEKQIAHLAALMVEQSDTRQTVVAKQFIVKDAQGARRAELGMPEGDPPLGPWLGLFDANEKVRACMGVGGEGVSGPWLEFYGPQENAALIVRAYDDEAGPCIVLSDADSKPRVRIAMQDLGPVIQVLGPNGEQRATIRATEDGPSITFTDEAGKPNLVLAGDAPAVLLRDASNKASLHVGFLGSGQPLLLMDDVNGEHRLKLGLETDGPRLVMSDKDGNVNANLVVQQGTPCLVFGKDGKVIWSTPA
jgi:hypothetical protein